jgi:very-short-patch-repair endonuclease/DNA polymerase III delta prime subunit
LDSATGTPELHETDKNVKIPPAIELEYDGRINFAMQQNAIPVVKLLRIVNNSDVPLEDLTVSLRLDPELSEAFEHRIAGLAAHSAFTLEAPDLIISPGRLVNLIERETALVSVEVSCSGIETVKKSWPVEVLAFNEWNGISSLPELIAAFVLPNHPAIEEILTIVRKYMEKWSGDPALPGYQSKNPKLVLTMAAAVYSAIQELGITYVMPPASFEKAGQKVRLPEQILSTKMGTCLDLTLLISACFEQAGLHPLIVLVEGHAFPGVWLTNGVFTESVVDDPMRIRKRVDVYDICVFDSSAAAVRPPVPFDSARDKALEYLRDIDTFHYAVDVKAARNRGMRPLPIRLVEGGYGVLKDTDSNAAVDKNLPFSPEALRFMTDSEAAAPKALDESFTQKFERWKNKLLDLSLRNRLLNFRPSARTLPLLAHDLAVLEDGLAANTAFELWPRPRIGTGNDPRDVGLYKAKEGADLINEYLRKELEQKHLYVDLEEKELEKRLIDIWRSARTSLEETGANILYLALGFLAWYETPQSADRRMAPILLLPVELVRGSVRDRFRIRIAEDEVRINITLLQKLKVDFGLDISGLDEMPEDHSGYDIPKIFNSFRRAIMNFDRWELLEESHVGLFWFNKFLMWTDLQNGNDALLSSPVLQTLITGCDKRTVESPFISPDIIDREKAPGDCLCPVDADSSQLAAVYATESDQSFVIEGPPGTGKSQTITNIIAHNIAKGKTVLFVAEKMAALNVVHNRLKKCGFSPFCLELHSTKTHKGDIIRQFQEALEVARYLSPEEWESNSCELQKLRTMLNDYLDLLHKPRALGKSVFQVQSRLISLMDKPCLSLSISSPKDVDRDCYRTLEDEVDRFRNYAQITGAPTEHPLRAVGLTEYDAANRSAFSERLGRALEKTRQFKERADRFISFFCIPAGGASYNDLASLVNLAALLGPAHAPAARLLEEKDWAGIKNRIEKWIALGRERNACWTELSQRYDRKLIDLDLNELRILFSRWSGAFFAQSFIMLFSPRQKISKVSLKKLPANKDILEHIEKAMKLRDNEKVIDAAGDEGRSFLGNLWDGTETNWDQVENILKWAEDYRRIMSWFTSRYKGNGEASARRFLEYVCSSEPHSAEEQDRIMLRELCESFAALMPLHREVLKEMAIDSGIAWGGDEAPDFLGRLEQSLQQWIAHGDLLRDWCSYRKSLSRIENLGLSSLGAAHFNGTLTTPDLIPVFERSFYETWLNAVIKSEPMLIEFHGTEQNRRIEKFRTLDKKTITLARQYILAALAARTPGTNGNAVPSSDLGTLQRELQKKRNHMSIRKLLLQIKNLVPRLKPCFLMSPLSVAQYLSPGLPPFDLVIFDEASQVPIWDALGALARGKQSVVVGDPRQLPPTAFFSKADSGDETEEDFEELESILDECTACSLPDHILRWHYRSRHEHLIAFSNVHYYASRLHTFPSAGGEKKSFGVSFRHIPDGFYDKGATRTNRKEAEAVVSEIVTRLRNPEEARRSIGVVTFSQPQQTLIEDLLDAARRDNVDIEPYFTDTVPEPVFIKNLENVQGDERDVMLFSIGYGPDRNGKISVNFGPLNQKGGERRLNVAITRAREQVVVFSSLTADMIDLSRTGATGVKHLRSFLDFALRGPIALQESVTVKSDQDYESLFEEEVGKALEGRGWTIHRQVGCSGYRIDLAVADPEKPGAFLLGIECDGARYHSSRCARDRDRLRHEVLESLGWQLYHIWSTDWWHNKAGELNKLIQVIEEAKLRKAASAEDGAQASASEPQTAYEEAAVEAEPLKEVSLCASASAPQADNYYLYYPIGQPMGNQELFLRPDQKRTLIMRLKDIVDYESPISKREASRRLIAMWGIQKLGTRIQSYIDDVIRLAQKESLFTVAQEILWKREHDPSCWDQFRVPHPDAVTKREMEDIPPREIANASFQLLKQCIAIPPDDLIRQTAKLFGFARTGTKVLESGKNALRLLEEEGRCTFEDGKVVVKE